MIIFSPPFLDSADNHIFGTGLFFQMLQMILDATSENGFFKSQKQISALIIVSATCPDSHPEESKSLGY
jgi:hypothetical protein